MAANDWIIVVVCHTKPDVYNYISKLLMMKQISRPIITTVFDRVESISFSPAYSSRRTRFTMTDND